MCKKNFGQFLSPKFWKTSEKVFITQSALSRQIKNLEQELGFQLFERDKRNVQLTSAGEFLRAEFTKILIDFESVTRHAKQIAEGEIGTIRIGHPASITFSVLPKILSELAQKHPNIIAQMFEVDSVDIDTSLLTHRIDLAFNRELPKAKELSSKLLMTENFALVVPANHPINQAKKVNLSELKDEWFVLPSLAGKSEHAAQLRAIFAEAEIEDTDADALACDRSEVSDGERRQATGAGARHDRRYRPHHPPAVARAGSPCRA